MHTVNPKRAIIIVCPKNNKNNNLDRSIPRSYREIANTSGNKPNVGKPNKYVNHMDDFASRILKEFEIKVRPPLSVVAKVITNSQEIEVCCKEMKQLTACEEDFEDINRLISRILRPSPVK